jgi:uncharacterized protein (TIGR03435 family)
MRDPASKEAGTISFSRSAWTESDRSRLHGLKAGELICSFVIALTLLVAQQAAPKPAFEVATIKRSTSLDGGGTIFTPSGAQFRAINIDARSLITFAYRGSGRLFNSQVLNGPGWLESERFDIVAKSGDAQVAAPAAELSRAMPLLVQSLLEDRFKLKLHRETRQLQRYVLSVARKDGSLGPPDRARAPSTSSWTGRRSRPRRTSHRCFRRFKNSLASNSSPSADWWT